MNSTVFKVNQGYYFPLSFRIFAWSLPFFSFFFVVEENYLLAVPTLVMMVLLLTTRYEIRLDVHQKQVHEYLWVLGFKKGQPHTYEAIHKVIFSKRNQSKTYNSRGSSSTIRYTTYHLMLSLDEGTIELASSEKRASLEKIRQKLFTYTGTLPVEDRI